jgi:DNA-binding response OmpR family regulator
MGIPNPQSSYLPILVVDSDQPAAERLADYLRHHGFHADVATSCWSAVEAVRKSAYGTLIVVANLKQTSDLECLAVLRSEAPRTWIIVISLRTYPDARQVVLGCGADSLLIAPFSLTELWGRLLAFARRSRPV